MSDKIKEKIGIAIGRASMCWSKTPEGVFNSTEAENIVNELYLLFLQETNRAIQEDKLTFPMQPVTLPYITLPKKEVSSTKCSTCGLEWKGTMGYVCPNSACPVQPKITC